MCEHDTQESSVLLVAVILLSFPVSGVCQGGESRTMDALLMSLESNGREGLIKNLKDSDQSDPQVLEILRASRAEIEARVQGAAEASATVLNRYLAGETDRRLAQRLAQDIYDLDVLEHNVALEVVAAATQLLEGDRLERLNLLADELEIQWQEARFKRVLKIGGIVVGAVVVAGVAFYLTTKVFALVERMRESYAKACLREAGPLPKTRSMVYLITSTFSGGGSGVIFARWVYFNAIRRNPRIVLSEPAVFDSDDAIPREATAVLDGRLFLHRIDEAPHTEDLILDRP